MSFECAGCHEYKAGVGLDGPQYCDDCRRPTCDTPGCGKPICNTDVPAMVERIRELEAAVLETSRHLFGKCDCRTKHPGAYTEVACAGLAEKPLIPLIETGPSPEYEHRLRRSE